ncbi:glutaminyl-peptide cyclotransferase [Geomonas terrae]|nr:glutaminyl-peptide cyclotransferase [Geomonas terrae]
MHSAHEKTPRFCGEPVTARQLELIRGVVNDCPGISRTELAGTVCELLDWRRPSGRLKTAECRAFLEGLDGTLFRLPPTRPGRPRGSRTSTCASETGDSVLSGPLHAFGPLEIVPVAGKKEQALWRSLVERHHYLGHKVPFGAHIRYFVRLHAPSPVIVGCLQFSSPAWRMEARDRHIGWDDAARGENLQRVVCNSRFLVLPTVQVKNLASAALSLALRRLAADWEERFGVRPLLAETLVDGSRYAGTCYKAANWIEVGCTTGRGRNDRDHARHGESPKKVFLFPLVKGAVPLLRQAKGQAPLPERHTDGARPSEAAPTRKRCEHGRSDMVKKIARRLCATAVMATLFGCGASVDSLVHQSTSLHPQQVRRSQSGATPVPTQIPLYTYQVVKSWPHYHWSFTEGLTFQDGVLLESSGLYERSAIMKVWPGSGQVLSSEGVPRDYFAEGITVLHDRLYMVTLSGDGIIYDHKTLHRKGEFSVDGEGWGLTNDGKHLIMSDGSNRIKFINPETFQTERSVEVSCNGTPLRNLNALQYVKGEIYANIWKTDYIVRINPANGAVVGWVNLKGLLPLNERSRDPDHVLNGIAYDEKSDRLVVTGKMWPSYFEIRLEQVARAES